ncbi:MAG: response regulator [Candidatus Melainabacteria bacterium]|nr:MAG: response regulator [Candidatus Melainabacteria bacterium]
MASRVLIIGDDANLTDFLIARIKEYGLEVECAINTNEAMDFLFQNNYSLIFMDMQTPGLSGYSLGSSIRKFEHYKAKLAVPIIAICESPDESKCLTSGINLCISKPLSAEKLSDSVSKLLPHRV